MRSVRVGKMQKQLQLNQCERLMTSETMSTVPEVHQALDQLMTRYVETFAQAQQRLRLPEVPEWELEIARDGASEQPTWQPVLQTQPLAFEALEKALKLTFHESVKALYDRYFAADLSLAWQQHGFDLIQVMGPEDGERLQANLAGHVMMKQRLKQPETLFIGVAHDYDDLLVTVDNASGAVGLEWLGRPQHEELAPTLAEFLRSAEPKVVSENS